MENVLFHLIILLNPLILDVEPGIGLTESAWLAQKDGLSMLIESVFLFLTNVPLMMKLVPVLLAIKVMTLKTDNVSSPFLTI